MKKALLILISTLLLASCSQSEDGPQFVWDHNVYDHVSADGDSLVSTLLNYDRCQISDITMDGKVYDLDHILGTDLEADVLAHIRASVDGTHVTTIIAPNTDTVAHDFTVQVWCGNCTSPGITIHQQAGKAKDHIILPSDTDSVRVGTLQVSDITSTSATVTCYFKCLYPEGHCGVLLTSASDTLDVDPGYRESGVYQVPLTQLNPSTQYTCQTYIRIGTVQRMGQQLQFQTKGTPTHSCTDEHHPHAIDMGLPSHTKWSCCNIGSNAPSDYGNYYAWAMTDPYYDNYTYDGKVKQEIATSMNPVNIAGTKYDVAHTDWGGSWCMPTGDQWKELKERCNWEWTTQDGIAGMMVTGPNGGQIFLPAAGYHSHTGVQSDGYIGNFWGTGLNDYWYPFQLSFDSWGCTTQYSDASQGCSVRAVSR